MSLPRATLFTIGALVVALLGWGALIYTTASFNDAEERWTAERSALDNQVAELTRTGEELQTQVRELEATLAEERNAAGDLAALRDEIDQANARLSERMALLGEREQQIAAAETELGGLQEQLSAAQAGIDRAKALVNQRMALLGERERDLAELRRQQARRDSDAESADARLSAVRERLNQRLAVLGARERDLETLRREYAEQPPLVQPAFQEHSAPLERAEARSHEGSHRAEGERVDLTASAAPRVKVRAGHHGKFERVAFEWPEAIEYNVVHHAEQVTVAFSRPGRIDLSRIVDHLGRLVLHAWAENGEAVDRITLRVLPDARVRSFSLEGDRIVAIDVFGGTAARTVALSGPDAEQDAIQELRQALEQRDEAIEGLLARVDQRDAAIESLRARVEQLERTVALSGGELDRVTAGEATVTPSVESIPRPRPRSPSLAALKEPPVEPPAASATASQAQGPEGTGARAGRETAQAETPAPGQVEVDEEAAERALEFTLVQQGALLLPLGRAEFTPSFTYTRRTRDFPVVVDGRLAEREVRRNEFQFLGSLFVGLPLDSQLELGLPYNLVEQEIVDGVGGTAVEESSSTGHAFGDFSVGLAKTVLRERNWWPDVVLRVNWDTGTGERGDNDVVLDGGFQELTGSISLTKRQDPLVFVGGAFYEAAFENNDIDPGDSLGFAIGTFLAASPNTSLRVVLNQSLIDESKVDGQSVDGSDQVQSILTFGASAILGRNVLLDGAVGVGLTDDSPDYSVSISLPIRFSTPGL